MRSADRRFSPSAPCLVADHLQALGSPFTGHFPPFFSVASALYRAATTIPTPVCASRERDPRVGRHRCGM
jgi:hypothetical protein